ncbi:MAG: DUF427 domain-containing protein [Microscillaceae bacterium]|nr:DUF427 domain-containing protein [Microscillaceae bacterium]
MKNIEKIPPKPGQESVWDYPRPPKVEKVNRHVQVIFNHVVIAESRNPYRVIETSHPPVYYFTHQEVRMEYLSLNQEVSFCEFKGKANYYDLKVDDKEAGDVAWTYLKPTKNYEIVQDLIAFYPGRVDGCYVDGEKAESQEGSFYGGWITSHVVGPFKGGTGTWGW